MQMSELARAGGVPVPTVKYYLREGLLPPGEATSATRATYDERHLRRLRLIRALVEVGPLRLDPVRAVLAAVEDESADLHHVIGAAHTALAPSGTACPPARQAVDRLLRRHRWRVPDDSTNRQALAMAVAGLERAGVALDDAALDVYADAAAAIARTDVDSVPTDTAEHAIEHVVVGTVLMEPVLLALRRLAQEHLSGRRLGRRQVRTTRTTRG